MGQLVNGRWTEAPVAPIAKDGSFVRADAAFRDRVSNEPGARFLAEPGRYRLYVSLACPWAHRTLVVRALKGLEDAIPVSVVSPLMLEHGWVFVASGRFAPSPGPSGHSSALGAADWHEGFEPFPAATNDPVLGAKCLYEVYQRAKPDYTGKVTVPVFFDTKEMTIVNNESSEIIRMLDTAFDGLATRRIEPLYPESLRAEIDEVNARVYATVNNGVYRAGFAKSQPAHEEAIHALLDSLDWLEARLDGRAFLVGDRLTEADIRLFTTLARFDAVYHVHFKCNVRRLIDYPRLAAFARRIYEMPGVAATVDFDHIKHHYYRSHPFVNPSGLVPLGPAVDFRSSPR